MLLNNIYGSIFALITNKTTKTDNNNIHPILKLREHNSQPWRIYCVEVFSNLGVTEIFLTEKNLVFK